MPIFKKNQYRYWTKNIRQGRKINFSGKRIKSLRFLLIAAIILSAIVGIGYLSAFSSFFKIREISIEGISRIPREDIERAVKESLDKKILFWKFESNFLTFSSHSLGATLREIFPQIDFIKISRKPFHSLVIKISERKEVGIWCGAKKIENAEETVTGILPIAQGEKTGDCFYIDKKGIIFNYSPRLGGSLFLVIKDFSSRELQIGEKTADEKFMDNLIKLRNKITSNMEFKVYEFKFYSPSDLKMSTSEGWEAYFNPSADLEKQYDDLELILKEKIRPEERENLKYIDLRMEGRVYYK